MCRKARQVLVELDAERLHVGKGGRLGIGAREHQAEIPFGSLETAVRYSTPIMVGCAHG